MLGFGEVCVERSARVVVLLSRTLERETETAVEVAVSMVDSEF